MLIGLHDTETTGPPKYGPGIRSDDPAQPHVVQLGVVTFNDDDFEPIDKWSMIVRPDGWSIDEREIGDDGKPTAFMSHGITQERAMAEGRPLAEVLDRFYEEVYAKVDESAAFNAQFDSKLLRTASLRRYGRDQFPYAHLGIKPRICVMRTAAPFARGPKARFVKLVEAYQWATGIEKIEGAHDAMIDAEAARVVLKHAVTTKGPEVIQRLALRELEGAAR